jgi:hypothetical protein
VNRARLDPSNLGLPPIIGRIDTEILPLVLAFNEAGMETFASCAGHGGAFSPYVAFHATLSQVQYIEQGLRDAFAFGLLHHEWAIMGRIEGPERHSFDLRIWWTQSDIRDCLALKSRWLASDFRAIGTLVLGLMSGNHRTDEYHERQEKEHQRNTGLSAIARTSRRITQSRRAWVPAMRTHAGFWRNLFGTIRADCRNHRLPPYALMAKIFTTKHPQQIIDPEKTHHIRPWDASAQAAAWIWLEAHPGGYVRILLDATFSPVLLLYLQDAGNGRSA